MMVVFNAVDERDLRSRNSDACRERLGLWEAIVMCVWDVVPGSGVSAASASSVVQAGGQCSRWA